MGLFDLFLKDNTKNDIYDLTDLEKEELDNNNYDLYNFEEEELEEDDYYFDDDEN